MQLIEQLKNFIKYENNAWFKSWVLADEKFPTRYNKDISQRVKGNIRPCLDTLAKKVHDNFWEIYTAQKTEKVLNNSPHPAIKIDGIGSAEYFYFETKKVAVYDATTGNLHQDFADFPKFMFHYNAQEGSYYEWREQGHIVTCSEIPETERSVPYPSILKERSYEKWDMTNIGAQVRTNIYCYANNEEEARCLINAYMREKQMQWTNSWLRPLSESNKR